jgi:undecaprenyl-diphosphatase
MVDYLYQIDKSIFYFINFTLSNVVFDNFFPFITNLRNWLPIYLIGISLIIYKDKTRAFYIIFGIILLITISDQISSHLLKNFFPRLRPMNDPYNIPIIRILVGKTSTLSFPSSHNFNNFAVAVFLSYYYTSYRIYFYSIAALVGFSRIYVGAHYPSDVLGGAIIGLLIGFMFIIIYNKILEYILAKRRASKSTSK